jgi:hypothetical protein
MAPTPKRSLKRTVADTVEGRSPQFLLSSLALAMVISLVAGLAIGIKVEQHRATKKTKPIVATKKKAKKTVKVKTASTAPLNGRVIRSGPRLLVISTKKGKRFSIVVVPKTKIEATTAATASDIVVGTRVVFAAKPTAATTSTTAGATPTTGSGSGTGGKVIRTTFTATAILVMTAKLRVGYLVTSVTPGSMKVRLPSGQIVTISTTGAYIRKTRPALKAQITKGRRVLVKTILLPAPKRKGKAKAKRPIVRRPIALEIVVLPVGTAFG